MTRGSARDEDPAGREQPTPPSTTTERPGTDEDDRTPAALGDLMPTPGA